MGKQAGRSNGIVRETARFQNDGKDYEKSFDRIFSKKGNRDGNMNDDDFKFDVEPEADEIDLTVYYINKLFTTDRAFVLEIDLCLDNVRYKLCINGQIRNCNKTTFLNHWRASKIKV